MKNKKYLAWIFSGESMNKTLTVHSFLINRLCENFENYPIEKKVEKMVYFY